LAIADQERDCRTSLRRYGLRDDSAQAKLRRTLELAELLSSAKRCQADFLSQDRKLPHLNAPMDCTL
jgi:hypothetical protein